MMCISSSCGFSAGASPRVVECSAKFHTSVNSTFFDRRIGRHDISVRHHRPQPARALEDFHMRPYSSWPGYIRLVSQLATAPP